MSTLDARALLSPVAALGLLTLGLVGGCGEDEGASPCHAVRKCITLSCKERFAAGKDSEAFVECVDWCRTSRGVPKGEHAYCAEKIGVECIQDWYSLSCVRARSRCKSGVYRPTKEGGC